MKSKDRVFPAPEHTYPIDDGELQQTTRTVAVLTRS